MLETKNNVVIDCIIIGWVRYREYEISPRKFNDI